MLIFEAPDFWNYTPSVLLRYLLKPFSLIYSIIVRRNYRKKYNFRSKTSKVIAIGAVTVGGSGKTIVTSSLCDILKSEDKNVAVLSRGYGRTTTETLMVDPSAHTFREVGDEPLLLSKYATVVVDKDRAKSLKLAEESSKNPYDFFLLDDGLTQRYLEPNIRIVVIDESQKFGNGEMFPLGPNRLNFDEIKYHIDAVVVLRNESKKKSELNSGLLNFSPVISGKLQQDFSGINKKDKFLAFCGIGYPEKFFRSLEDKLNVVKTLSFPDHYPYTSLSIIKLLDLYQNLGANLITTEKDLVRIPSSFHKFIKSVPVKVVWDNEEQIKQLLF